MLNFTNIVVEHFLEELKLAYTRTYGGLHKEYCEIIEWCGTMALEIISTSDALYHNVEHTVLVTLVGQEILRGKHIKEGGVSCRDWLHCIISLLCHDIGYVKGVCRGDKPQLNQFATGVGNEVVTLEPGSTDAGLTRYHVDRGKLFVQERFGGHEIIDVPTIQSNIEWTRFPVPNREDHDHHVDLFPSIVRSADLIGQLGDPRYLQKVAALFYEFEETGANRAIGYKTPGDLRTSYPKFYWSGVYPFVKDAITYLSFTQAGQGYLAQLYANVFRMEHENGSNQFERPSEPNEGVSE